MKYKRHGLSKTRLNRIWRRMRYRCFTETCDSFKDYGGRGITICNEWNDFTIFYSWAINNGYRDDLSIDRIDVNGNYCPENCRWTTQSEQMNNRRNNHFITYQGKTKTISQWAKDSNMTWHSLYKRLYRGIPFEVAIQNPVKKKEVNHE